MPYGRTMKSKRYFGNIFCQGSGRQDLYLGFGWSSAALDSAAVADASSREGEKKGLSKTFKCLKLSNPSCDVCS